MYKFFNAFKTFSRNPVVREKAKEVATEVITEAASVVIKTLISAAFSRAYKAGSGFNGRSGCFFAENTKPNLGAGSTSKVNP